MEIREFQERMRHAFYETDSRRGTAGTFMWLVEEVGELSSALRGKTGSDDLADEFADVFAWLCSLANLADVDVQAACEKKYSPDRIDKDKFKHGGA